jgi:hypothetical protein
MTKIDSAAHLAAVIRQQVSALRAPVQVDGRKRASMGRTAPSSASRRQAPEDLAAVVARRVQAIDPDDPGKARKAFRIFLESVLLAELGDALINDPAFYRLVDQVQGQMEADPRLRAEIERAAQALLAGNSQIR